ncbi:late embryogenesis abundant protein At1g64065-like isoform X1 [Neltuma alba]|uniref:late embryogenesis abundant protein At1g64065-like isoform X1 n=1 Tax=Neltuma alba TaxID=207710 RepID=UPI0010A4BB7A|nr:late embryogenesis abundant protein At1g64065-like isoform X1 [Prosopis alba]
MAGSREQVKPLTPLSFTNSSSDEHQAIFINDDRLIKSRRRRYVQCCGCATAIVLVIVVTFLIFSFTVYNVKEPRLSLNGVTVLNSTRSNDANMTLIADVSVKNPNVFTFRFGSSTTTLYYNGTGIGEGRTPPGKALGRKTMRLNVTVEIVTEKLMENPSLRSGLIREKALNISSYTKVGGNVKVLNLIKRKVEVSMNCTVVYNKTSGSTHAEACFTSIGF